MILLTPVGFFSALRALSIRSRDYRNVSHWDCQFLFVSAIIPLSVFVIFTLQNDPKLNWTGPLWLALLPLMVLDLVPSILRSSYMTRVMRIPMGWKLTFIGVFLLFGGGFHYFAIGLPGLGYIKGMQAPVAWEEFGHAIEKIKDDVEPELSGVPIIVGMDQYFLASELAFYRTKAGQESENLEDRLSNTSSRHLFRHIGLMYEIWSPVERIVGSDCIIIGFVPDDVADYRIAPFFDSLTEIKKLTITKNNSPVHTFVWRVGYRYHLVGR